jgi:hypothetical protein
MHTPHVSAGLHRHGATAGLHCHGANTSSCGPTHLGQAPMSSPWPLRIIFQSGKVLPAPGQRRAAGSRLLQRCRLQSEERQCPGERAWWPPEGSCGGYGGGVRRAPTPKSALVVTGAGAPGCPVRPLRRQCITRPGHTLGRRVKGMPTPPVPSLAAWWGLVGADVAGPQHARLTKVSFYT